MLQFSHHMLGLSCNEESDSIFSCPNADNLYASPRSLPLLPHVCARMRKTGCSLPLWCGGETQTTQAHEAAAAWRSSPGPRPHTQEPCVTLG